MALPKKYAFGIGRCKGTDLIYERYKFLAKEYFLSEERREKRKSIDRQENELHKQYVRVTQFLETYVNRSSDLTEGNPDDVVADLLERLPQNQREDVMLNLRHPIMLMRIASLLNSHLVEDVLEAGKKTEREDDALVTDNRSVLDILLAILSEQAASSNTSETSSNTSSTRLGILSWMKNSAKTSSRFFTASLT